MDGRAALIRSPLNCLYGAWSLSGLYRLRALAPALVAAALTLGVPAHAQTPAGADTATLRGWVKEMERSPRGPFARIRWFCKDGTVLPPEPYACKEHGGGVQHGEWSEHTRELRRRGYLVANVLAGTDPADLLADPEAPKHLAFIVVERFLMKVDDGWILRRARYYRGAFQEEGERRAARRLLLALVSSPEWVRHRFLLVRELARWVPHGTEVASVTEVRQLASTLAGRDPGFARLRNKIHVHPEAQDAAAVRAYMATAPAEMQADYAHLANLIDKVYHAPAAAEAVRTLAGQIDQADLRRQLDEAAGRLDGADARTRFAELARLLALLRERFEDGASARERLALLDASVGLELGAFTAATEEVDRLQRASRRARVQWLALCVKAVYGTGLISAREQHALEEAFHELDRRKAALGQYRSSLDYLARVASWAAAMARLHFSPAVDKLAEIEPLATRYTDDLLRSSPLLAYDQVLDGLLKDANRLMNLQHTLFGRTVGGGMRALNPGLARGILRLAGAREHIGHYDPNGIYVLPATAADLPPVAGILTEAAGSQLSHVQLLARNLGIPNVVVAPGLMPRLRAMAGKRVVLAVSPGGVIQLSEDGPRWDPFFAERKRVRKDYLIHPDLARLDLHTRDLIPLRKLRAPDSGRVAGPKAANLGELKHLFPHTVPEGLLIPFGVFRALLDHPEASGGPSMFRWMQQQYAAIRAEPEGPAREAALNTMLARIRAWIAGVDLGEAFKERLHKAMRRTFGAEPYGVFVRSDTNVEDLPGFTGAGLNRTVFNVVGFEHVLAALREVWASPFSERAYAWRQAHMPQPEHVYPAVLLLRSVPSEVSGVMVTADVDTGNRGVISVAANEGLGGAVEGQGAETLRVDVSSGKAHLLAQASAPTKTVLNPAGGVEHVPTTAQDTVLRPEELAKLVALARELPRRYPALVDSRGRPVAADVEFGFVHGELRLFQIRPFVQSRRAQQNRYLRRLDERLKSAAHSTVALDQPPEEEQ